MKEPRPRESLAAVRKRAEVELLRGAELGTCWFISRPLVLHRSLLAIEQSADYKSDARVDDEVPRLSSRFQRVEDDLECIGHRDPHHGGLHAAPNGHRRLDGVAVAPEEVEQTGPREVWGQRRFRALKLVPAQTLVPPRRRFPASKRVPHAQLHIPALVHGASLR